MKQFNNFSSQLFPILFAVITFFGLTLLLFVYLRFLNIFPLQSKIILMVRPLDIFVGLTIYVKTAVDFALFIGNLMHRHPGMKNRVAIEIGTALGNGIGTLVILSIWVFFKEIPILLILMMITAALVLLRMAEESLREFTVHGSQFTVIKSFTACILKILHSFNKLFDPIFGKLLPRSHKNDTFHKTFFALFLFSLTIPFLLGLDDFAGYISLFSLINIFGFAIGVFLGHMLLTAALFALPQKTTQFVRQPVILLLGGLVFLGLAILGLGESLQMITKLVL